MHRPIGLNVMLVMVPLGLVLMTMMMLQHPMTMMMLPVVVQGFCWM